MIPVSAVIITRNEERNIGEALESVREFGDIVVVDAFSTDRTPEICRGYTERVYQHEWQGFSRQKQTAVDYASKDWVLLLDADERVTPELRSEIAEVIGGTGVSGFYVPRKNFFLGKWIRHGGWWPDHTLRLFRKDSARLEEREVHEKVAVSGTTGFLKSPIEHYTYRNLSQYIGKMEAYTTLSAAGLSAGRTSFPVLSMSVNPLFTFAKMFILRQGFRDGVRGLILAILYSFYTFLKYAKVWELKQKE